MTIRLPWHSAPSSRQARRCSTTNPSCLTPEELAHNELLRIENFERYSQQSKPGELPPRKKLHTFNQESHQQ